MLYKNPEERKGGAAVEIEQILDEITDICGKYNASKVILFGSRAKGTARDTSDIDIAVAGAERFAELEEEIENIPTLYTVDLVNLDTCKNTLLLEDIEEYGRKIFEKV